MRLVRHFDESPGQICVAVNELERASMDLRFEGRRVARSKLISVATGSWSRECGAPLWLQGSLRRYSAFRFNLRTEPRR
jgi:hypothetical protein